MNDFIIHFAYASDDKTDECPVYCPSCLYYFSVFYSNKHLEKCKSLPTDTRETAEYLGDYLKEFVKNKRQKISKEQHDKTDDLSILLNYILTIFLNIFFSIFSSRIGEQIP